MTTAEIVVGGEHEAAVRTTGEATQLQANLARMRDAGVRHVVLETSSHGIHLHRVDGTRYAAALFTNLTRDHLDLHGSMEEYYRAKRQLFLWAEGPKLANADDAHGRRISEEVEGVSTFGVAEESNVRRRRIATRRRTPSHSGDHTHAVPTGRAARVCFTSRASLSSACSRTHSSIAATSRGPVIPSATSTSACVRTSLFNDAGR